MIDVNWAYPIEIGGQKFSIEGHAEYIDSRDNEFGGKVKSWILAQPQIRWDIGNALFGNPGKAYVGTELQYWNNKLGDGDTDEFARRGQTVVAPGLYPKRDLACPRLARHGARG
jgi:hypothetical protein